MKKINLVALAATFLCISVAINISIRYKDSFTYLTEKAYYGGKVMAGLRCLDNGYNLLAANDPPVFQIVFHFRERGRYQIELNGAIGAIAPHYDPPPEDLVHVAFIWDTEKDGGKTAKNLHLSHFESGGHYGVTVTIRKNLDNGGHIGESHDFFF